jgi:hypothetical protein
MVIVLPVESIVYHSERAPRFTLGVRSTKELEVTSTPGLRVTLVDPTEIVATPLTLSALIRPLERNA